MMKLNKYNILIVFLLSTLAISAQKIDKKYSEKFNVNKDVVLELNTNATDVEIETWNKNVVEINAVMEVEGATQKEADDLFENWHFEALGNSKRVVVESQTAHSLHFIPAIEMDFDFPDIIDIDIPEMNIDLPDIDIEISEFEFPEIDMPDFDFDDIEFDYEAYENDSTYLKKYKIRINDRMQQFNESGWKQKIDSLRSSKEFKHQIKEVKKEIKRHKEELKNNKEQMHAIKEARVEVRKAMEEVKREMKRINIDSIKRLHRKDMYHSISDHKKFKIKRTIKIKMPKDVELELNVRHGKLKVPSTTKKVSANLSYGNFYADVLNGAGNDVVISNSPVNIRQLKSGTITLKDVPNAMFGTFSNANLFSNSSDVIIELVGENSAISSKFGKLEINKVTPDFVKLNLILDNTKAIFDFSNADYTYQINDKKSTVNFGNTINQSSKTRKEIVNYLKGYFKDNQSKNTILLTGVYSTIAIN